MDLPQQHEHGEYWEAVTMIFDVTMDDVIRGVLTSQAAVTARVRDAVAVDSFVTTPELSARIPLYSSHKGERTPERMMYCDCMYLVHTYPLFHKLAQE